MHELGIKQVSELSVRYLIHTVLICGSDTGSDDWMMSGSDICRSAIIDVFMPKSCVTVQYNIPKKVPVVISCLSLHRTHLYVVSINRMLLSRAFPIVRGYIVRG